MEAKSLMFFAIILIYSVIVFVFSKYKNPELFSEIKYTLVTVAITTLFFVLFDSKFVILGAKFYNPEFNFGINLLNVPVEAILYWLVVSMGSLFIYKKICYSMPAINKDNLFVIISLLLLGLTAFLFWFNRTKTYTFYVCLFFIFYFGYIIFRNRYKHILSDFYVAFFVGLFPWALMELFFVKLPVTSFEIQSISGLDILGLPVENLFLYLLLVFMNITIYGFFSAKKYF